MLPPNEINAVRSIVSRFITPRAPSEPLHDFINRRREAVHQWLNRPRNPRESDNDYTRRTSTFERVLTALPQIESEDRLAEHPIDDSSRHSNSRTRAPRPIPTQQEVPAVSWQPNSPPRSVLRSIPGALSDAHENEPPHGPYFRPSPAVSRRSYAATDMSARINRHRDQARQFLDRLIAEKVDRQPDDRSIAEVLRKAKLPLPEPYTGKASAELFQKWISDFVCWCNNMNIVGADFDNKRVELLRTNLSGTAANWYYTEVISPDRQVHDWTFRSLIYALYDRFVPRSTRLQAIEDFERCHYSSSDGAQGFWSRLRVIAARLPSEPDAYTLRRRFLFGLPKEIFDLITVTKGLSAEYSNSDELIAAAEEIENSLRMVRSHDKHLRSASTVGTSDATHDARTRPDRNRSHHDHLNSSKSGRYGDEKASSSRNHPDRVYQHKDKGRFHGNSFKIGRRDNEVSTSPDKKQTPSATSKPTFNAATAQCFACGNYGHIASDPKCPKYTKRINLAVAGDPSDSSPSDDHSGAPDGAGSDNDRNDEGNEHLSFNDTAHIIDNSGSDSGPTKDNHSDYLSLSADEDDTPPRISGMTARFGMAFTKPRPVKGTDESPIYMYDAKMRRKKPAPPADPNQPARSAESQMLVTVSATVGGIKALTCIDTGSTVDCVTPELVKVCNLNSFKLEEQLPLQLACKGSRSKLTFGTRTNIELGPLSSKEFFDIVNLDRYDCVIGIPYLRKHGIVVDLAANTLTVNGTTIHGMSREEEAGYDSLRARRTQGLTPPRFPASINPPESNQATQGSATSPPPSSGNATQSPRPILGKASIRVTPEDLKPRQEHWRKAFMSVYGPPYNEIPLPPLRAVNHELNLKDPAKAYGYRTPRCPEAFRSQLSDKTTLYIESGRWFPSIARHAIPLLCLAKKDGRLRTVVDARERNDNTYLDVTPLPDQDLVRDSVARARYRTKIDMTDAFEQIRVIPEHESRTAFASPLGTFLSRVIQQGDLNGPSTCQRLMTHIFRERIGRTVYVYLDDIFIFTDTYAEHEENLAWVLQRLREEKLYISHKKLDVYSVSMDCLGHVVDSQGLHSASDKMARIRDWPVPASYKEVQQFLGLVQYLQHFMPDIASYTGVLSDMCRNGRKFIWREIHQKAFDSILHIASQDVVLRPIDARRPAEDRIWLICDASTTGVGAILAQGPKWETAHPAAFMSKKLSIAQRSYYPMELEALAALEAVEKFRDKITGVKFTIVTDHQALEFFRNRNPRNPRHMRWVQRLVGLNFDFLYVRGHRNAAADALSRRFALDPPDTQYPTQDLVDIDIRLDPDGDDLPYERLNASASPSSAASYKVQRTSDSPQSTPRLAMSYPPADKPCVQLDEDDDGPPPLVDIESCRKKNGLTEIHNSGVQFSSSSANPTSTFQNPLPAHILQQAHRFVNRYGPNVISLEILSSLNTVEIYQLALDSFASHCHAFHVAVEQASSEYMDLTAKIRNPKQPRDDTPSQKDINAPRLGMLLSSRPRRTIQRTERSLWVDPGSDAGEQPTQVRQRRRNQTPAEPEPPSSVSASDSLDHFNAENTPLQLPVSRDGKNDQPPPVPRSEITSASRVPQATHSKGPDPHAVDTTPAISTPANPSDSQPSGNGLPDSITFGDYDRFLDVLRSGYAADSFFRIILANPSHHRAFSIRKGLIIHHSSNNDELLCIPDVVFEGRRAREIIIDRAHQTVGHMAKLKTDNYVRRSYWWPSLGRDIALFCRTCETCQVTKNDHQKPPGLLHSLPIPARPWESISMDFVGPFPESNQYDLLWVVMDRLTSMTHLIPITTKTSAPDLASKFISEIVRLHGIPESILSDRDPRFTSKFWKELHRLLGSNLLMSTAFHPQTDGITERRIQNVSSILRTLVSDDQKDWSDKVPMTEFALNSALNASSGYAPFELNYGYLPVTIPSIPKSFYPGVSAFVETAREYLAAAHDALIESRVVQTHHANKHRREEPEFSIGNKVYLSTKNISLPKGLAAKLTPRYIGPYTITKADRAFSRYTIDIPSILSARGVFSTFHVSLLRPHFPSDDKQFPNRKLHHVYDLEGTGDQEYEVEEILAHRWQGRSIQFLVKWTLGDSSWIPYHDAQHLTALDAYFKLRNVAHWKQLPRVPDNAD